MQHQKNPFTQVTRARLKQVRIACHCQEEKLAKLLILQVIKCLELGVVSRCAGPLCVSSLTLCVLEMRDSMIKLLREVMLNLSKITATVQNAQPILEFISSELLTSA